MLYTVLCYIIYVYVIRELLCRQQHTDQLELHMLFGKGSGVSASRTLWYIEREAMLMD